MKIFEIVNRSLAGVLGLIGVVLVILIFRTWSGDFDLTTDEGIAQREAAVGWIGSAVDYTILITEIALVLLVLGLLVIGWFINWKRMLPLYGGLIGLAIIFGISQGMADSSFPAVEGLSADVSMLSGAGLYMVYILSGMAIVAIAYSMVSKLFR